MKQVDLYLIHDPRLVKNGDFEGTWKEFEKIQEQGLSKCAQPLEYYLTWNNATSLLCRSIGVSNFTVEDLQKLNKTAFVTPAVNQVCLMHIKVGFMSRYLFTQIRLHPYNHAEHASLLEYHAKHGIVTEAYGSLAYGFFSSLLPILN